MSTETATSSTTPVRGESLTPGVELAAVFFDFDGVIIDSVPIKAQVFGEMIAVHFPESIRDQAMAYYHSHGGTSRVAKFRYIYEHLLHEKVSDATVMALGTQFAARVSEAVMTCRYVPGAFEFLTTYHASIPLFLISGTPESELKSIALQRGIARYFRGIQGSPSDKITIGTGIIDRFGLPRERVCFVGDATTDRDAAAALGTKFVGVAGPHLSPYVTGEELIIDDLTSLVAILPQLGIRPPIVADGSINT